MVKQALETIKGHILAYVSLIFGIGITTYLAITHLDYIGVGIIIILATIIYMLYEYKDK